MAADDTSTSPPQTAQPTEPCWLTAQPSAPRQPSEARQPSAPRWLTAQEQQAWLALNGVAMLLPYALDAQLQHDDDLSLFEYSVLAMLSETPQRTLRMKRLAGLANGSLSRLSHVVSRLERRGYVRRESLPEDGRTTMAVLTDAGWEAIVAAAPNHVTAVRRMVIDPMTPEEINQLASVCKKILQALAPNCEVPQDYLQRVDEICPASGQELGPVREPAAATSST